MADIDLKAATPDASLDVNAYLFGADSQVAAAPSVYQVSTLKTLLLGGGSLAITAAKTLTATGSLTLAGTDGKTLTVSNSLTLAGTDGTTLTGPGSSTTLAGLSIANSFTTSQNVTPSSDVISLALRRNGAAQTANILEIQTEANAFLSGFDKSGILTLGAASTQTGTLKLVGTTSGTVTLSVADAAGTYTLKLPTTDGNASEFLQTDGSGNLTWAAGGGGVTIDSTAITSGTAGRLLFESATNKVTESSLLSFDSTNGALSVGGATVTTSNPVLNLSQTWNAGAVTFTGIKLNVTSTASAAASLLMDLQVGAGSQFKVAKNGDVTLAGLSQATLQADANITYINHPSGSINLGINGGYGLLIKASRVAIPSTYSYGWASGSDTSGTIDTILSRAAAATLQLGAADAAAPVAQTLQVQSVVAGTSNTAGTNFTIAGSKGTGTGAGGSIIFQVAPAGSTGTSQNALATALTIAPSGTGGALSVSGGTVTTSTPVLDLSQTWNAGAVTFTGLKFNVTDTASASASLLADIQMGGTSVFKIVKIANGANRTAAIDFNGADYSSASNTLIRYNGNAAYGLYVPGAGGWALSINSTTSFHMNSVGVRVASGGQYSFANSTNATDNGQTFLTSPAAATLQLGAADAAAPVAQTLQVQSVVAGTSNTAGTNFTIAGSKGTGTGAGGSIIFQVAPAGTTGTSQNALATALTIDSTKLATFASGILADYYITFSTGGNASGTIAGVSNTIYFGADAFVFRTQANANATYVYADAADTLAMKNGGTAQEFRVYKTTTGPVYKSIKGDQNLIAISGAAFTDGAAAQTGTLTNAPVAGNPTKWIPIDDNGTTRYIPAW